MTNFKPIRQLNVWRTLSTGENTPVGVLAQNKQGVFFQYDERYLARYGNLSPFRLKADSTIQAAPQQPHNGLHGIFADSLPDGWGLLLQDRFFRQNGFPLTQITAMDRLALVGRSAIGALFFEPNQDYPIDDEVDLAKLGLQAQAVFDGQTDEVLHQLLRSGSSGGARPKAQVYTDGNLRHICRTIAQANDEAWLIKFTSQNLLLRHDEGLCEAIYLKMAQQAGIETVEWQLLPAPEKSGAGQWLAVKRFDWLPSHQTGRLHMLSVAGLLDVNFRLPSLDYVDLIKVGKILTRSPVTGTEILRRAIFNLFSANQDDHAKNWAFLQNDDGTWQLSPFYDVTFSPTRFNEHTTSFDGFGKCPPMNAIQNLAKHAGLDSWADVRDIMQATVEAISSFEQKACDLVVSRENSQLIQKQLNEIYQQNKTLLK